MNLSVHWNRDFHQVMQPISTVLPQTNPTHSPGSLIAASTRTSHYCYRRGRRQPITDCRTTSLHPRLNLTTTGKKPVHTSSGSSPFSARRKDCCSTPQPTVKEIRNTHTQQKSTQPLRNFCTGKPLKNDDLLLRRKTPQKELLWYHIQRRKIVGFWQSPFSPSLFSKKRSTSKYSFFFFFS